MSCEPDWSHEDERRLKDLFAAFDDVHASTSSKEHAIAAARALESTSTRTSKPRRVRFRALKIAAAAACLAAATIGGVAYATPAAEVSISSGSTSVNLEVNHFGITISAKADDTDVQQAIDAAHVRNQPYEKTLDLVLETISHPDEQPELAVSSPNDAMRGQMEEQGARAIERRGAELNHAEQATPSFDEADASRPDDHLLAAPGEANAPDQASPTSPAPDASTPAEPEGEAPSTPDASQEISEPDDPLQQSSYGERLAQH